MTRVIRTGDLEPAIGLVDYIAVGLMQYEDGERCLCTIGYIEDETPDNETVARAEYLFINDVITENGSHFCKETIKLADACGYIVNDEDL